MVRWFKVVIIFLMMRWDVVYVDFDIYIKCFYNWVDEFDEIMRMLIKVVFLGLLFFFWIYRINYVRLFYKIFFYRCYMVFKSIIIIIKV